MLVECAAENDVATPGSGNHVRSTLRTNFAGAMGHTGITEARRMYEHSLTADGIRMCLRRLWDILATQASGIYHQRSTRYEVDGRFQVAKLSNPLDLTRRTLARGTGDLRGEPAQVSWGVQRERAEFVHVRRLSSCWMLRSILFPDATTHLTKPIRLCVVGLDIIACERHEREQVLRQLLGQLLELLVRVLIPAPVCHVVACKRAPVSASPWRGKRL